MYLQLICLMDCFMINSLSGTILMPITNGLGKLQYTASKRHKCKFNEYLCSKFRLSQRLH